MFEGSVLYNDIPACQYEGSYKMVFGDEDYWISMDSCNSFWDEANDKYFSLKKKELEEFIEIIEKYGGSKPCK